MIRLALLMAGLIGLSLSPLSAQTPPTYYFEFEVDETRLVDRTKENSDLSAAIDASMDVARKRIGGDDFVLRRIGERRIALTLTRKNAPQAARDVFGISGQLDFLLVDFTAEQHDLESGRVKPGRIIKPRPDGFGHVALFLDGGLSGDRLTDARAGIDSYTDAPVIMLSFDPKGAKQLATMTAANVGKPMAILLDGEVLSVPTIHEQILGGQVQISGSFTQKKRGRIGDEAAQRRAANAVQIGRRAVDRSCTINAALARGVGLCRCDTIAVHNAWVRAPHPPKTAVV